jgi:hypothetical protein
MMQNAIVYPMVKLIATHTSHVQRFEYVPSTNLR